MKSLFFITLGVVLTMLIDAPQSSSLIFIAALLFTILVNLDDINIISLGTTLIFFKIIEEILFTIFPITGDSVTPNFFINNRIYLTHFCLDSLLFLFIIFRAPLWRPLLSFLKQKTGGIHLINADMGLVVVYALFILVDLTAAGENLIRNLEHVGFTEETAKSYWQWDWVYYHYSDIKRALMGFEFFVIWSTITKLLRNKFDHKVA